MGIIFQKSKQGEYKGFHCQGHAEYSKRGNPDIVCAAISMLVINTLNSLEELCHTSMNVDDDEDSGMIMCPQDEEVKKSPRPKGAGQTSSGTPWHELQNQRSRFKWDN